MQPRSTNKIERFFVVVVVRNPLKTQMGSIFKHPCLWQGGMAQWTPLLERGFKLWPFKYHSQLKNSAPEGKSCAVNSHIACL